MEEIVTWHEGRPTKEGLYLIQADDGNVSISYYYKNGDTFRYEMEGGCKIVRYANKPVGKR